jgi:hypothetical protein
VSGARTWAAREGGNPSTSSQWNGVNGSSETDDWIEEEGEEVREFIPHISPHLF